MTPLFDNHYDLLTSTYINFDKENKFRDIDKFIKISEDLYQNNIIGGIINLFFMSDEEMQEELGISKSKYNNVLDVFELSVKQLEFFKMAGYIPSDIKFLYSIEGCDYLNIEDLDKLYELGLRSILPVWNNENKYGSGIRSDKGLTDLGKELISKAVDLGIIIDVSHANEKTFYNIIDYISELKELGKNPTVIASHSNLKTFCYNERNLTEDQVNSLKNVGGYLGLFTNSKFLVNDFDKLSLEQRQMNFLEMLKYVVYDLKYPINKILLSTDDMDYYPTDKYHNSNAFNMKTISSDLEHLLLTTFDEEIVKKLMNENSMDLYESVLNKNKIR